MSQMKRPSSIPQKAAATHPADNLVRPSAEPAGNERGGALNAQPAPREEKAPTQHIGTTSAAASLDEPFSENLGIRVRPSRRRDLKRLQLQLSLDTDKPVHLQDLLDAAIGEFIAKHQS